MDLCRQEPAVGAVTVEGPGLVAGPGTPRSAAQGGSQELVLAGMGSVAIGDARPVVLVSAEEEVPTPGRPVLTCDLTGAGPAVTGVVYLGLSPVSSEPGGASTAAQPPRVV